ncbi:hypothetical protein PAHAL_1G091100 [Panicum hallii]|uniref:Uncharacterized protein n=1 Tax=Panicum hallii TaxID=206008 RepID=A0A2T8KUK3_9POAL|nr:hypothetical protein PAHAL_1G091100 [Panicum hallii]
MRRPHPRDGLHLATDRRPPRFVSPRPSRNTFLFREPPNPVLRATPLPMMRRPPLPVGRSLLPIGHPPLHLSLSVLGGWRSPPPAPLPFRVRGALSASSTTGTNSSVLPKCQTEPPVHPSSIRPPVRSSPPSIPPAVRATNTEQLSVLLPSLHLQPPI